MNYPKTFYNPHDGSEFVATTHEEAQGCLNGGWSDTPVAPAPKPDKKKKKEADGE